MKLIIRSKIMGQTLTFSRPGGGYIYVDVNGKPGILGRQICSGGRLQGSTISYTGEDLKQFSAICRRWYRAYVANVRDDYYAR